MHVCPTNPTVPPIVFGVVELQATAVLLAVLGVLIAFSVLFSRQIDRLGVPVVLLFLVLGMLGGSEGIGGIAFDDYRHAVRMGTVYLVLILFDGGMNTSLAAVRHVLLPAGLLATVGVALTAGLVAVCARLLGLAWTEALLLGAVVSSTDAAAVLAVLRGGRLSLRPKVGQTARGRVVHQRPDGRHPHGRHDPRRHFARRILLDDALGRAAAIGDRRGRRHCVGVAGAARRAPRAAGHAWGCTRP